MAETKEYFDNLIHLLHLEKEEEMRQFEQLMQSTTVAQRVALGICWYPLNVVETGFGFGDYPFVVIERTRSTEIQHQFSAGKSVILFSSDPQAPQAIKAALQYLQGNQMKLVFFLDDEPELLDWGKLGVMLMPDVNAFKEQESALKLISNAKNCRLADLRDVLILRSSAEKLHEEDWIWSPTNRLNDSQNDGVRQILEAKDVFLIHGPPGTGKTTTIIEATRQLVEQGEQVLLAAPSNAAADLLSRNAIDQGIRVLRIGNLTRIDEELEQITIEGQLRLQPDYASIRKYRKQAEELRRMAGKYKRQFGREEREQRKLILQEAKSIGKEARKLEEYIIQRLVENAQVITCTLMGANHRLLQDIQFATVIIDEAAQSPEPACWIPILKADRLILAGDPFQLPPTVKSEEAAKKGLRVTLMEKILNRLPTQLLTEQYRMNREVMEFSNRWFYGGKLVAHEQVANWNIPGEPAVQFIDTAGIGWDEQMNEETRSVCNPGEAKLIHFLVNDLLEKQPQLPMEIGIISPYKEQIRSLTDLFINQSFPKHIKINIQTIDSFQGQERDVIFLSLVRSNESNEIGFLKDYRRMNVAMTRAKKKLVVIGDSATLSKDLFYKSFIDFSEEIAAYTSAWEYQTFI